MNVAFPVLILTLVLLPGFLFRLTMLRGSFRRSPVTAQQISGDLAWLVVASAILHLLLGELFARLHFAPSAAVLLPLLIGNYGSGSAYLGAAVTDLSARHAAYLTYFSTVSAAGYLLGLGVHHLIRSRRLDLRYRWLRFPNDWYYLLDARVNAAEFDGRLFTPDVYVTAIVAADPQGGPLLYRGVVEDWTLDGSGALENVVLRDVFRRRLADDRSPGQPGSGTAGDARYYPVDGDRFILRRNECTTLNVQYLYSVPDEVLDDEPDFLRDQLPPEDEGGA